MCVYVLLIINSSEDINYELTTHGNTLARHLGQTNKSTAIKTV